MKHSEKKIDRIEARLVSLEQTLKSLATSVSSRPVVVDEPRSRKIAPETTPIQNQLDPSEIGSSDIYDDETTYSGGSSLVAHVAQASSLLDQTSHKPEGSEAEAAIDQLREIARRQHEPRQEHRTGFRPDSRPYSFSPSSLELPPSELVMACIRDRKGDSKPEEDFSSLTEIRIVG